MRELFDLGLSDVTINSMLEASPEIIYLNHDEIYDKVLLLEKYGCKKSQIVNIIGSNSNYLLRTNVEIENLVNCLLNHGFKLLNILFDSNPYILNLEPFEIDNYISNRKSSGDSIENIIDDLESNPYLFDEI